MTPNRPPAGESLDPSNEGPNRDGKGGARSALTRGSARESQDAIGHSDRPVKIENIHNVIKTVAAVSSAVVVTMFLQRGEELSPQKLLFSMTLASVALLLISVFVSGILYRRRAHDHPYSWLYRHTTLLYVSGVVGAFLLGWSLTFIGSEGYILELDDDEVGFNRGDLIAANLSFTDQGQVSRALLTVVNNGNSTKVLTEAALEVEIRDPTVRCAGNFPIIRLEDQIFVSSGSVESLAATVEGGALDGSRLSATGRFVPFCNDLSLSISVPVHLAIGPGETEMLAIDIPKQMNGVLEDMILYSGDKSDYDLGASRTVELDMNADDAIWSSATLALSTSQRNSFACVTRLLSSDPSLTGASEELSNEGCKRLSSQDG
jgi:hypothetical protein